MTINAVTPPSWVERVARGLGGRLPSEAIREDARRRRLAVLALGALGRAVTAAELSDLFGEPMERALSEAAQRGYCRPLDGALHEPTEKTSLGMAITLLSSEEVALGLRAVADHVTGDEDRALLLIAVDPTGEGLEQARRLGSRDPAFASLADGLGWALERGDPATRPPPPPLPAFGARAERACGALATAGHMLARLGRGQAGLALVEWALSDARSGGPMAWEQGSLAVACTQFLIDAGRRDEAAAFAHAAQEALPARIRCAHARTVLLLFEARVAIDRLARPSADHLFAQAEADARAGGFEDWLALAKLGHATIARQRGRADVAERLCSEALELTLGNRRFEAGVLYNLGLAYLAQGRVLDAQAAWRSPLDMLELTFQRLTSYPTAILLDCFLGDLDAAQRNVDELIHQAPETPQGRLSVALCRAHLLAARGRWSEALEALRGVPHQRPEAQVDLYALALEPLRVRCLLESARLEEAATAIVELSREHVGAGRAELHPQLHLLDARVALARGDLARARRALGRAQRQGEQLQALDLEWQARLTAFDLARAEGRNGEPERAAAIEALERLTAGMTAEELRRFRAAYDRPAVLERLGLWVEATEPPLPYLRGRSPAYRDMVERLRKVAASNASVLLLGETGAGKELAARAVHDLSPRATGPFVALNCGAVTDELLLSELFGHEKGAFTGAVARHAGCFERADGGTLFLDEIGEISPYGQAALLRALQERTFERVGGTQAVKVDVRLVAATNRSLTEAVARGEFRQDLYFRLSGLEVVVPPLRERGDDAVLLAEHFLEAVAQERGRPVKRLTTEARALLREYAWPGNVRELKNTLEAADTLSKGTVIDAEVLRPLLRNTALNGAAQRPVESAPGAAPDWFRLFRQHQGPLREFLALIQLTCIERSLSEHAGNIAASAKDLGMSRSRLTQIVLADPDLRRVARR